MNEYFIEKVINIVISLKKVPIDLSGCSQIMFGKRLALSLDHVSVQKVHKLLCSLKNETSSSVDDLDNLSV